MKPMVSVIIPVYNVEEYLAECLDSVLAQTLTDFEVICVNDGSTDGSLAILEAYAKKDSRITFFSQENSGLSTTRNHAIERATGKYLFFVDSDDVILPETFQELTDYADRNELQLLAYDASAFSTDRTMDKQTIKFQDNYDRNSNDHYPALSEGPELFRLMVEESKFMAPAWVTMLRRDFFLENNLWFHSGMLMEDFPYSVKAFLSAKKAGYIHKPFYSRRVRQDSIMTQALSFARPQGYFLGVMDVLEFMREHSDLELTKEQHAALTVALKRRLEIANRQCRSLPSDELGKAYSMTATEHLFFTLLVSDDAEQQEKLDALHHALDGIVAEIYRICKKHNIHCYMYGGTLLGAVRNKHFIPWDDDVDLAMNYDDFLRFTEICKTELSDQFFFQTHITDPEFPRMAIRIRKNGTYFDEPVFATKNMHHGIFVDILPLTYFPKGKISGKIAMNLMLMLHEICCFRRCHSKKAIAKRLYKLGTKLPIKKRYAIRRKCLNYIHKHSDKSHLVSFASHYKPYRKRVFKAEWFKDGVEMEFDGMMLEAPIGWNEYLTQVYGANYIVPLPVSQQKYHGNLTTLVL